MSRYPILASAAFPQYHTMIAQLRGLICEIGEGHAVIDVGGVGYLVFASMRTLSQLTVNSQQVSLAIETHVREDHIYLFGFLSPAERSMFRLLSTVQGVGSKVALAILDILDNDALVLAIASEDSAVLTQASGVGAKLAKRIISELKDKNIDIALEVASSPQSQKSASPESQIQTDSISALVNLGYDKSLAYKVVISILQDPANQDIASEACIRLALQALAQT